MGSSLKTPHLVEVTGLEPEIYIEEKPLDSTYYRAALFFYNPLFNPLYFLIGFFKQDFINYGLEFICCYILITCDGVPIYAESVHIFGMTDY